MPEDLTSSLGQAAPPPEPTPSSTGFGLGVPNPVNIPLAGSPVQGAPVPPPQAQTQAPDTSHVQGHVLGKLLNGLGGKHNEYAIDPASGKTVAVPVQEKPGQTFRSLLAYGLLGAQGIGEKEGDHTFAQGLLSGLGGGMKASTEGQEKLDNQRRQQAQIDYANKLKADENNRENKKLSLQEQLNHVQIANFNQEQAARAITMDAESYRIAKEKGMDEASPLLHSAEVQIAADAPKVQGYKELGIDPIHGATNLTAAELHEYVKQHQGVVTESMGLHTDTRTTFDPKTGKATVEPLYSVYPPLNKVPASLVEGLKAVGAGEKGNRLNPMYNQMLAANTSGATVDTGKIISAYRELTDYSKIQKDAMDVQVKRSEIRARDAETYVHSLEAQFQKFNLKNATEAKEGGDLLRDHYDPLDNNLKNAEALGVDSKTGQLLDFSKNNPTTNKPWTPKEQAEAARQRTLLGRVIDGFYFDKLDEYSKLSRVSKDSDGNIVSNEPQLNALFTELSGLSSSRNKLLGGTGAPVVNSSGAFAGLDPTLVPKAVQTTQFFKKLGENNPNTIKSQMDGQGVPENVQAAVFKALGLAPPPPAPSLPPNRAEQVARWASENTAPTSTTFLPAP